MPATSTPARRPRGRPRLDRDDTVAGTVQALDRGMQLLKILSKDGSATLSDLALSAGLPASTAHRLLGTMQKNGVVEFHETTQEWLIGVEAFRIGSAFIRRNNLLEAGVEAMRRLVDETGETASIAIADKGQVVFLGQVETPNPVRAFFPPGTRAPIHASGIGKTLLAQLERGKVEAILQDRGLPELTGKTLTAPGELFRELDIIRRRGWSMDDEEAYVGMRCIAAPIFDAAGAPVAGISVSGPSSRLSDDLAPEIAIHVKRAAAEVTSRTGGSVPSRPAETAEK